MPIIGICRSERCPSNRIEQTVSRCLIHTLSGRPRLRIPPLGTNGPINFINEHDGLRKNILSTRKYGRSNSTTKLHNTRSTDWTSTSIYAIPHANNQHVGSSRFTRCRYINPNKNGFKRHQIIFRNGKVFGGLELVEYFEDGYYFE